MQSSLFEDPAKFPLVLCQFLIMFLIFFAGFCSFDEEPISPKEHYPISLQDDIVAKRSCSQRSQLIYLNCPQELEVV